MNPIQFGKFLAELRNEKNLTQEEVASKLFIDKRKISRWECGTSIPEFEMIIKLSEIYDVTLYELSMCKRIEDEKISKKILNKFKKAKDFTKYKLKKKIFIIAKVTIVILLIISAIYTIKNQGKVRIYELESLDKNYNIEGNYIKYGDKGILSIVNIEYPNNDNEKYDECFYEIENENKRLTNISNNLLMGKYFKNYNKMRGHITIDNEYVSQNSDFTFKMICRNSDGNTLTRLFNFKFKEIFNNNLF